MRRCVGEGALNQKYISPLTFRHEKYYLTLHQVKAIKCLLKTGDTERIIYYGNMCRSREVYVLAANYLQVKRIILTLHATPMPSFSSIRIMILTPHTTCRGWTGTAMERSPRQSSLSTRKPGLWICWRVGDGGDSVGGSSGVIDGDVNVCRFLRGLCPGRDR